MGCFALQNCGSGAAIFMTSIIRKIDNKVGWEAGLIRVVSVKKQGCGAFAFYQNDVNQQCAKLFFYKDRSVVTSLYSINPEA